MEGEFDSTARIQFMLVAPEEGSSVGSGGAGTGFFFGCIVDMVNRDVKACQWVETYCNGLSNCLPPFTVESRPVDSPEKPCTVQPYESHLKQSIALLRFVVVISVTFGVCGLVIVKVVDILLHNNRDVCRNREVRRTPLHSSKCFFLHFGSALSISISAASIETCSRIATSVTRP